MGSNLAAVFPADHGVRYHRTGQSGGHAVEQFPWFVPIQTHGSQAADRAEDWDFGPRRKIAFPMFGDGIFTQEGSAWKHSRELLRPQFHFKQYDDLGVFRQSVDDLVEIMAQSGSVVDVQPLFFRLTLDTTTAFLFGESVRSLQSPSGAGEETFAEAFNTAQKYVAKRFRLLDLYWLIGGRDFDRACRNLRRFADQVIDRNLNRTDDKAGDEKKYVFLEALARESPDRNALRDQIINILAAGRDTTACLLSWTFFLLVRHPKVIEKLRTEINTASTDPAELNRQSLKDLGYLQNVLKESKSDQSPQQSDSLGPNECQLALRLYPSLPVNTRTSTRTTVLPTGGGPDLKSPVLIPKGSAVAYSTYAMHRRPDLYGMDAEIFRPERWDEEMPMNHDPVKHRWGYLPFHGGPRICLGMDFALTEAAYTVVRIFQTFPNIELPDGEPVELTGVEKQTITLTISSAKGCKIRLSKQQ